MNKTDYCKIKGELIRSALAGKNVSEGLKELSLMAFKWCKTDSDIEWLRVCGKTKNFTKIMPVKKAEKLMFAAMNMEPIGDSAFSDRCAKRAMAYFNLCRNHSKKSKRIRIGVAIACSLLLAVVAVGVWYGDKTGVFYGEEGVSFFADGQEYRQENAVKYNNCVQLSIPVKKGYDATGVVDAKTNTRLFDASGRSLAVVSKRNLSDYDNCVLEVTYEPHVYSAQVMTAKNVALASLAYTVEDDPEDILEDPQYLEGYVFDGWYTDAKYKKPFTGNFWDYADSEVPLVLYPHYSLNGWTLSWELNGGAFKADVLDAYTILSDVRLPNGEMVVREGYTLKGWAVNGTLIDYFTPTVMKDTVLSAVWEPIQYKLKYELNGGALDEAAAPFTIEDEFLLDIPVRRGYTFEGWYANRFFTKSAEAIEQGTIGDKTFYAKWAPIVYTISYELNGGENNLLNPGSYTTEKNVELQMPVRRGYAFEGWYANRIFTEPAEAIEQGTIGDKTFYARWTPIVYTISYELNGGENNLLNPITYTTEKSVKLQMPVRKGYAFEGWYANRIFTKSAEAIEQGTIGDKTFYAKWTPLVYTINYELNGGENNPLNPITYTAEKNVKLQIPVRKGYTFRGWFFSGGEKIEELNAAVNESVHLIAVWEANQYTITVNPNNGSGIYQQSVRYGEFYSIAQPARKGYTFTGYSMSGEPIDSVGEYTFTFDIALLANYSVNQYTISYVSDAITVSKQQVTFDAPYSLYIPQAKLNHEFDGWFDKEVGGNRVSDGVYRTDGNTVLYASWTEVLVINLASGNDYTIDDSIGKAYVIGNYSVANEVMTDVNIKISARDYALTIELINAGFKASKNNVAIDCENSTFTLKVINHGTSYIEGGNGSNGANGISGKSMTSSNCDGSRGLDGQYAINCGRIIFAEAGDQPSSLTIKAGDGGNGGNGGVDTDRSRMWLNYTPDGGNGGNTKAALYCVSYSINGTTVAFEQGNAGTKGKAGSRGDWWCSACYGDDGKNGTVYPKDVEYK